MGVEPIFVIAIDEWNNAVRVFRYVLADEWYV